MQCGPPSQLQEVALDACREYTAAEELGVLLLVRHGGSQSQSRNPFDLVYDQ